MGALKEFLGALFPDPADGNIEVRILPSRDRAFGTHNDLAELGAFVHEHAEQNVYFGVATRGEKDGRLGGSADHCRVAHALWADIDFKATPEGEVRARLALSPTPPSAVIHSGGGLHVYWLLKDPMPADGVLRAWLRRLALTLEADMASAEPARVLRLPGTLNHKYTPPRPVTLEALEPDRRYALADFAWLREEESRPSSPARPQYSVGVVDLDKAVNVLSKLWPGNESGRRHQFAQHLGGWLAHKSVSEDAAVLLVRRAAEGAGDSDTTDRERVVRDSYAAYAAGKAVTGLPRALELVPELTDVMPMLNEALGIVPRPLISVDEMNQPAPLREVIDTLPADARLGLGKQFADLYGAVYESSWENLYFAFLTHLGARVAKHLRLDNDLGIEPRLYTILLGESGNARKSQAAKIAEADFAWADRGGQDRKPGDVPVFPIARGVGSGEALGEAVLQTDRRSVIFAPDEFGHVTNKMKIEGNSLISILLTLFDSTTWGNSTKGKPFVVEDASLSMLTCCVDEAFPTLFDPRGGADQGIVNRLFLVAGPASNGPQFDPQVNSRGRASVRRDLRQMLYPYQQMGLLQQRRVNRAPEARRIQRAWYEDEFYTTHNPMMRRLDTYVERLMMLLAASSGQPATGDLLITPEIAQAAVSTARWQYKLRQRLTPIIADTQAAKVEQTIERAFVRAGEQGLSRRDAQRRTHPDRVGFDSWNRAFEALTRNGNLVPLEPMADGQMEKGGRQPSVRYRVSQEFR